VNLTKERKIYLGLLGLGIVALGADRLTRNAPADKAREADAAVPLVAPAAAVPRAADKPSPHAPTTAPARASLAALLRRCAATRPAPARQSADVFRVSAAWPGAVAPAAAAAARPDPVARFRAAHRLTGVLLSDDDRRAIIDGRALAVGERLDGFTLVSVDKDRAVLAAKQGRVILTLMRRDGVAGLDR
jgi:hypothetical protein